MNKLKDDKIIKLKKTEKNVEASFDTIEKVDIIPGDSFDLGSFCFTDEDSKPKVTFKPVPESGE